MPPISVTAAIVRIWPKWKGVSRSMRTTRRRSFSCTSAARVKRLDVTPVAISPIVRTLHGAINMPSVLKDPDAMLAPTSAILCTKLARFLSSLDDGKSSDASVSSAALVSTRWVSTPIAANISSARTPYTAPEAPLIPIIRRFNIVVMNLVRFVNEKTLGVSPIP